MPERRPRILLVDDDSDDRALARLVIAHALPEVEVEEIAGAPAFAQACGRRSFDLIVLERKLAWADGLAILAALKEDLPGLPVLLFTRFGDEEAGFRAARLGADEYLVKKPAGFLRLPRAIDAALGRARSHPAAGIRVDGLVEDVAARKEAEEELARRSAELRRSNEDLQQFASIASHELQEPVRMMERYAEILREDFAGRLGPGEEESIDAVVDAARRLRALIEDLLAFSRLESRERRTVRVSAEELLDKALANLEAAAEESGAAITRSPLPVIEADPGQIVRLFQNLLGNAIKFRGEEPPRIHVAAERRGGEQVFSVRDFGVGIAPADAESVFLLFKRLRPEIPGSGIGLALCQRIVERHGGRIWVEPGPDCGSIFFFTIPAPEDPTGWKKRASTNAVL
jgi:signal transduction histidine kinase